MSEENDFEEESEIEVLAREVEDLRKQVQTLGSQMKIMMMFILTVLIFTYMVSAGQLGFIVIVAIIVFPIALCCNTLEKSGI